MSNYIIDFSDPLKNEFSIAAGGFDGPGGSITSSSLRLYGRGALEWGEAVDEDLLRQLETYSSSTAPQNPINGQLWVETKYYYFDSGTTWYWFNPNTSVWTTPLSPYTAGLFTALPLISTIGSYYYATDTMQLFRWDSAYKQAAATWLERTFSTGVGAPINPPEQALLLWDAYTGGGMWGSTVTAADITAAFGHTPLFVDGTNAMTASLNAGSNKIINVVDPTNPQEVATKNYVDSAIPGGGTNVHTDGSSTMTGNLNLGGFKVINMADPTLAQDAVTKNYFDQRVAYGILSGLFITTPTYTFNFTASRNFAVTIQTNSQLLLPLNLAEGQSGTIMITQDGPGNRLLTYAAGWMFEGGTAPTLSTGSGAIDILVYFVPIGATSVFGTLYKNAL